MSKVLIVDDELSIRRLLRNTLERAGHQVVEAVDGRQALGRVATEHPDAVLLDLGLPDRDGLELVQLVKKAGDAIVLVVSARDATDQKVAALDLGADDFITKPFDGEELLARLRVALRNRGLATAVPKLVRAGDLEIDLERRVVRRGSGEESHLTRKEHDVLAVLAAHPGRVVTHQRILAAAWAGEEPRIEYLRIVIRNLRGKIEAPGAVGSVIANELGIGYRLLSDG